jgi:cupin 2 domain-containing protein
MPVANLFNTMPSPVGRDAPTEQFDTLLDRPGFRLERIVSTGQATPAGEWLSQPRAEWVVLLTGSAAVRFEDEALPRSLRPGDVLHITPDRRHRVESTDAAAATVWLALHYAEPANDATTHDATPHDAEGPRP